MKKIGAENHVITDFSKLNDVYEIYNDRNSVLKSVKEQRRKSLEYLAKYIESKPE